MAIGIIVEYNPFHNGHIRQLNWIRQKWPNEKIVVAMSDKFSQRGELCIDTFAHRKKIAKKYGVNKVIKLKFEQSVQAAHIFAHNAVIALHKAKIDKLVFGSESNNVEQMKQIAKYLIQHEEEFNELIRKFIKIDKLGYPKAFAIALEQLTGQSYSLPNDILGFEYVKTIVKNNLNIEVYTIERNISFHADEPIDSYASASHLRNMLRHNLDISQYSPSVIKNPLFIENLYEKFKKILRNTAIKKIKKIPLISEGIENLLLKNIHHKTYDEFVLACVSKRYTSARIKRIMAWILAKKWR